MIAPLVEYVGQLPAWIPASARLSLDCLPAEVSFLAHQFQAIARSQAGDHGDPKNTPASLQFPRLGDRKTEAAASSGEGGGIANRTFFP